MSKYARRRDENHGEIEAVFRRLLADHVTNCAHLGEVPDLYVSYAGRGLWVEIKRDGKAKYTSHQIRFMNSHAGTVARAETIEDAIAICNQLRREAQC